MINKLYNNPELKAMDGKGNVIIYEDGAFVYSNNKCNAIRLSIKNMSKLWIILEEV
jgi:hypothetical protein